VGEAGCELACGALRIWPAIPHRPVDHDHQEMRGWWPGATVASGV